MLFRDQVLEARNNRLTGKVILTQSPLFYIFPGTLFVILILSFILSMQVEYSRKETVNGYLIPKDGVIKIYPGREGVLDSLFVKEGQTVQVGDALAKIKNSQGLVSGEELSMAIRSELKTQINYLNIELKTNEVVFSKQEERVKRQIKRLKNNLVALEKAKSTTLKRMDIKSRKVRDNNVLLNRGFISTNDFSSIQEEYLLVVEAFNKLETDIASLVVRIDSLESELAALPEQELLSRVDTTRKISELNTELLEINNKYELVRIAPESGKVTAIQSAVGNQISSQTPLLYIIPENSPLEIELLLPTRSAGFVKNGDEVKIRFDAFPYQKFGVMNGIIINVDQAVVLPTDKILPLKFEEAMYRVRASLTSQSMSAYGKDFPLKPGMIAEADLVLEKRTLMEWLLEPIYAVKGKL